MEEVVAFTVWSLEWTQDVVVRLLHLDDEVLDDADIVTDLMVLNPPRSSSEFPLPPIPRPDIVSLRIKYPRNHDILLSIMHNYIPHCCTVQTQCFFNWLLQYPSLTLPCSLAVAIYFTLSADRPVTQTLQITTMLPSPSPKP